MPLEAAGQVLEVLYGTPGLAVVVLTEVNPGHDPEGESLSRYVDTVTGALVKGLTSSGRT